MVGFIVLLLVVLLLGGAIGDLMAQDPGYVLLAWGGYSIETSVWVAAVLLVLLVAVLRLVGWGLARLFNLRGGIRQWNHLRHRRRARRQTIQGLLALAEGDYDRAQKILAASAGRAETPLINWLHAARAAHEQGDGELRDEFLRRAHQSTPGARLPVGLTQAELQAEQGQHEQALATLLQLRREAPRHPTVLKLLRQCYEALGDWQALEELLPDLKKQKVLPPPDLDALARDIHRNRLDQAMAQDTGDGAALRSAWEALPRAARRDPGTTHHYALALARSGNPAAAEAVLRSRLGSGWDADLVRLYGRVAGKAPEKQLITAEGWLKERPNDPELLLTLGRLAMRNRQWSRARQYLEASVRRERDPEAAAELGRLLAALGEVDEGADYLREALTDGSGLVVDLPLPGGGEPDGDTKAQPEAVA